MPSSGCSSRAAKAIHDLLTNGGSILFPLLFKIFLTSTDFVHRLVVVKVVFTLSSSDIARCGLGVSVIVLWNLLSCLLQDPVILVVVLVTPLIHQVLEYFAHVRVVWPFFKFQVSAV